ncbi:unnamed protein product [Symbiodinium necroappetens]|uniref:Uncharacterized protein n=1 Tax=Symbiodinium necroappetens TaxID=1628268 RepID=A0A813BWI7_9DINO|nr:unnamed protein product [Symbiodinium necroappetens]
MFDETDYDALTGKRVAIVGFGAFAVENIRTCCEHRVDKIFLVCRRKNLCMPRMVSWWINGSAFPVSSADVLREMEVGMIPLTPLPSFFRGCAQAET